MSQEELDKISKSIDEYNATVNVAFVEKLEALLRIANVQKIQEPKTEETRYWAVVYTELEKIFAYVAQNLKE